MMKSGSEGSGKKAVWLSMEAKEATEGSMECQNASTARWKVIKLPNASR